MGLGLYRALLSDRSGQERFRRAIFETIRGGETVLDLGTGTGLHALFACQAGAKRVYAIEQHDIIELARAICRDNGYADRVVFVQGHSTSLELPERVDLIVTHQWLEGLLQSLPDARDRFLKEGGRTIPASVELHCAPLEAPSAYEETVGFWEKPHYGLSVAPGRAMAVNSRHQRAIEPEELLGEPVRLQLFDVGRLASGARSASVEAGVGRRGTLHALGFWVVEWLTEEIAISAAPPLTLPVLLWPHFFLPMERPITVEGGDTVRISMRMGADAGESWGVEVTVQDRQGRVEARSRHSSLGGLLLSKEALRGQAPDSTPRLTALGEAQRFALECCDGGAPLRWIEDAVHHRFPGVFRSRGEAAGFVARVVREFTT